MIAQTRNGNIDIENLTFSQLFEVCDSILGSEKEHPILGPLIWSRHQLNTLATRFSTISTFMLMNGLRGDFMKDLEHFILFKFKQLVLPSYLPKNRRVYEDLQREMNRRSSEYKVVLKKHLKSLPPEERIQLTDDEFDEFVSCGGGGAETIHKLSLVLVSPDDPIEESIKFIRKNIGIVTHPTPT